MALGDLAEKEYGGQSGGNRNPNPGDPRRRRVRAGQQRRGFQGGMGGMKGSRRGGMGLGRFSSGLNVPGRFSGMPGAGGITEALAGRGEFGPPGGLGMPGGTGGSKGWFFGLQDGLIPASDGKSVKDTFFGGRF